MSDRGYRKRQSITTANRRSLDAAAKWFAVRLTGGGGHDLAGAQLDPHLLRDIGLDDDTASRECAKPFWRA